MDVILLKDVQTLGKEGTVVAVKRGYARNFLVPQGLALPATESHVKLVAERTRLAQVKAQRQQQQAEALKQKLETRSLTLKLNVGDEDKAFGAVTAHDIFQALTQEGLPVEKHAIQLAEPIKALGIYEVPIRLHANITATIKVWVVKA